MFITPAAAAEEAERALAVTSIDDPVALNARLTGHAGPPLLVERLDVAQGEYYLVPWQGQGGIVMVVLVNAWTGKMGSLAVLPTPSRQLMTSAEEARNAVESQLGERLISEPRLVWQPSRESASPLQPFYHVRVPSGDAYVTADNVIYRQLTPFAKGG